MYTIKPEYIDLFGYDANTDMVITHDDIESLARGWEKPVDEIIEQLTPYNFHSAVELMDDDIREALHNDSTERSESRFLWDYEIRHQEKYGTPFQY